MEGVGRGVLKRLAANETRIRQQMMLGRPGHERAAAKLT